MNYSSNGPTAAAVAISSFVWYGGTDAIKEGEGVCYNTDYATTAVPVTTKSGKRANHVERPSTSNNRAFAGVLARNYPAASAGQFIEIYVPGSRGVNVALGVDTVIDVSMLTFQVGGGSAAGRFVGRGFPGRGSIIPRQTVTAVLESDTAGATWSMATDGKTLTMTSTTGLSAGDTVVILASDLDLLAGVKYLTAGKYEISSITSSTVLVLTASAAAGTLTAALGVTGYAYTGNPKCQADLLTGEESGGIQFVQPPTAGTDAMVGIMAGGVTYVCGTVTLGADAETDLAAGTTFGEKKGFWSLGTFTTHDFVVDAIAGKTMEGGTTLAELEDFDAPGDFAFLTWLGAWKCISTNVTEAAS